MNYFSDVFTPRTWSAFVADGCSVTAFSGGAMEKRAAAVSVGDRFLCYLKGKFAWVGALEATSGAYRSSEPIWGTDTFPVRVDVRPVVVLPDDQGLHLTELEGKVSFFTTGQYLGSVPSHFQGSPRRLRESDGEVVFRSLLARDDGVRVTLVADGGSSPDSDAQPILKSVHSEMQFLLSDFGLRTGCRVWVPKGDRPAITRFAPGFNIERLLGDLPMVFAGHAQETVRNIDVLWLRGNTIVAAFEVEHSTSIYSGLLRMSDLVAEFPNVSFPLYIVAPAERRENVRQEISRPTFRTLPRPLSQVAGFISYERLRSLAERFPDETARYLSAEVIETAAERSDA